MVTVVLRIPKAGTLYGPGKIFSGENEFQPFNHLKQHTLLGFHMYHRAQHYKLTLYCCGKCAQFKILTLTSDLLGKPFAAVVRILQSCNEGDVLMFIVKVFALFCQHLAK
jgi:hypothetical protein